MTTRPFGRFTWNAYSPMYVERLCEAVMEATRWHYQESREHSEAVSRGDI